MRTVGKTAAWFVGIFMLAMTTSLMQSCAPESKTAHLPPAGPIELDHVPALPPMAPIGSPVIIVVPSY